MRPLDVDGDISEAGVLFSLGGFGDNLRSEFSSWSKSKTHLLG